ncbi:hypothetical protein P691DRAFT_494775 [Macrolepiota fuliginosa MF-IS2]|uniref:Uncharacterized protein n=1 Tax=Macrolepiota fuliginosa MF-IS2 TaxID=1400762 RepID=A0A9P6BYC3_9AGAR|nr:hypothetical protein P691DRAFT_494775 [Macrolepiota fuliginosa MF-IS2]
MFWRTVVFAVVGTMVWWFAHGSCLLCHDAQNWWRGRALMFAVAWLYTVVYPAVQPSTTTSYDIFVIYLLLLGARILELGESGCHSGVIGHFAWDAARISQ